MEIKVVCAGCQVEIDREKERYTHLEDWNGKDLDGESWWHINCFKKAMNRDLNNLEKAAGLMLIKTQKIFKNIPEEFLK